jgi:hypothetical protein
VQRSGHSDDAQRKCNMIIKTQDVKKVNVSVRQNVTTVFLVWGHFRSNYKSHRSMIHGLIIGPACLPFFG